ncbi:hypothetical protein P153DRAFT_353730 [Dothidotthia symphoricarpi CBS 119687]|uniref:Fungal N-terminal domain-containing protein n=1 Tax=Dothidotthia symphoricarpi CBS 119687 TaxID=1392245 RepID=A0A6A6AN00_9PLEO|nr:uncharacterized protein P153DRAFT_353730 [Dothidotthia symphoricarpi CBS 119687]KAF2133362.1 hypothetical protein P153DRAFT_353730 [Dothidotthia symphoricarpi CBS 119687]
MAELVGLTASIIQIAGVGVKLSTTLYDFVGSAARADQEIAAIAGDVELTANALDSVGKVFENKDIQSIVSNRAIQDANNLIKRCEAVFKEISEVLDKRRKTWKNGKKSLSTLGKLSWPMKEQRVELLRRRLESLKNSLMLLLHVIQFANGQAKGEFEKKALEKECEKLRQLHECQQESLRRLQVIEGKLGEVNLDADETLRKLDPYSPIPIIEPSTTSTLSSPDDQLIAKYNTERPVMLYSLETSDSDDATTDDEGEHLTMVELSQCVEHVQKLLQRISVLQQTFEATQSTSHCPKNRVYKHYRRFCRKFESEMMPTKSANPPTPLPHSKIIPPVNDMYDSESSSQSACVSPMQQRNRAYKRTEEPPRNINGKMVCKHQECSNITFNRKYEWSKHMNKHDRPYKRHIERYEKPQVFKYSAGFLCDERESQQMRCQRSAIARCRLGDSISDTSDESDARPASKRIRRENEEEDVRLPVFVRDRTHDYYNEIHHNTTIDPPWSPQTIQDDSVLSSEEGDIVSLLLGMWTIRVH